MIRRDPATSGPLGCEKDGNDKSASRCLQFERYLELFACSRSLLGVAGIRCKSAIEAGKSKRESGKRLTKKGSAHSSIRRMGASVEAGQLPESFSLAGDENSI
jgi:hypothetical protein